MGVFFDMYIGNCTHQVQRFLYRVIENPRRLEQLIPIGGQIKIAVRNLSMADVDKIVADHVPYGLVRADEIDRTKPFFGLCYSIDKPIDVESLRRALLHNEKVLEERGATIRKESAVALNNAIEERTGQMSALELSIVEDNPDKHQGDSRIVDDTVRVSRDVNPDGSSKKRGRR